MTALQKKVLNAVSNGATIAEAARRAKTDYQYAYKIVKKANKSDVKTVTTKTATEVNTDRLATKIKELDREIQNLTAVRDFLTA